MSSNKLSNWLVENILSEEENKIKKIIGIYGGRFQPMGQHHAETFKWLKKKFPDSYIATSDKVDIPKSPFTFKEKQKIISGYGISPSDIVLTKSPYNPVEILKKYDPKTTAVVFIIGSKDMDEDPRFKIGFKKNGDPSYFQDYSKHKDNLEGFDKHGYLLTAPHVSLTVPHYGEMSGTLIRKALGDRELSDIQRHKLFKDIFGHDKKSVYDLVTNKLLSLTEVMESFAQYINYPKLIKEVSSSTGQGASFVDDRIHGFTQQANAYKNRVDYNANSLGWDVVDYMLDGEAHKDGVLKKGEGPIDRVSFMPKGIDTPTNNQNLKTTAGYSTWKTYINNIATLSGYEIIKFTMEAINGNHDLSFGVRCLIERFMPNVIVEGKILLTCGGAYGHMAHVFDDNELTFGDFKDLIKQSLTGELNVSNVVEKVDGQNIMITWKDNKLKAARNKSQIKEPISIAQISDMFAGRGDIHDAFVYAMVDLDAAISKLSDKDKVKIFNGGKNFMNLEIIYPATKNVIDYDRTILQFHGAIIYDDNGNAIGEVEGSGAKLADMIKKINQDVQAHFNIIGPNIVKISKGLNFSENQAKFLGQLNKLQSEFNLKDTDTLGMYHQSWWDNFISKKANLMGYAIPNNVLVGLIKRWAFADKAYDIRQMKKDITHPAFLEWATKFDKDDHKKQWKANIEPFETLFLGLGAEVMKNVEGFLTANPDKTVQDIRNQVTKTIRDIRNSGDLASLEKMETQLKRIQAIGGFKNIVPSEGIVIKYKGKMIKLTGIFAGINGLLGIVRYAR